MKERQIVMSRADHERLAHLSEDAWIAGGRKSPYLKNLNHDINAATVFDPAEMPDNVVAMHSKIRVKDMKSGEETEKVLVYPEEADSWNGKISILAPIGTALIGAKAGEEVEFEAPGGIQRLKVLEIVGE